MKSVVVTINLIQLFGPIPQRQSYLDIGMWSAQARTVCCDEARPPGELGGRAFPSDEMHRKANTINMNWKMEI
jgi:hypothetical protein